MPAAPYMNRQQRTEDGEHEHGRRTMQTQPPRLESVGTLAELARHVYEVVEQQPESPAREQHDAACIDPAQMSMGKTHSRRFLGYGRRVGDKACSALVISARLHRMPASV